MHLIGYNQDLIQHKFCFAKMFVCGFLQKDRRNEMKIRRKIELREIIENSTVLSEMLDQWDESDANEDALTTIKELHTTCENLQRTLSILAGEPEDRELQGMTLRIHVVIS